MHFFSLFEDPSKGIKYSPLETSQPIEPKAKKQKKDRSFHDDLIAQLSR